MKCVCGYEYTRDEMDWIDEAYVDVEDAGDEKFLKLNITATINKGSYGDLEEVFIYACPKCGTLKAGER